MFSYARKPIRYRSRCCRSDLYFVAKSEVSGVQSSDAPVHLGSLGNRDLKTVRRDPGFRLDAMEKLCDQRTFGIIRAPLEHGDLNNCVVGTAILRMNEVLIVQQDKALKALSAGYSKAAMTAP
ncbi:hypothetical protein QEH68_17580 [Paenarthrobacter sp. OM7]|uniref:hypothetical protein n=1 Tax=Paenarthrobacter sp. OM7 TaxID=3041264 RepID=UPI0024690B61|nr:hypothetical protein [Paenarthrobacter sp. OM7]WGM19812.1 hypothetical protein QEH68_17580 [Paenarthrobacter sp. OM7]